MRHGLARMMEGRSMPQPFSFDLRQRVVAAAQHQTQAEVAARYDVSASTVGKWCRRALATGTPAAKPHRGGGPGKIDAAGAEVLRGLVVERNDRTLAELAAGYRARTGVGVSVSAVCRACQRLDLRRKKKVLHGIPGKAARILRKK